MFAQPFLTVAAMAMGLSVMLCAWSKGRVRRDDLDVHPFPFTLEELELRPMLLEAPIRYNQVIMLEGPDCYELLVCSEYGELRDVERGSNEEVVLERGLRLAVCLKAGFERRQLGQV